MNEQEKERRGFASMDPSKQREIASKGGIAAHQYGRAHEWTREEAREAGRRGGRVSSKGRQKKVADSAPELPISATGPLARAWDDPPSDDNIVSSSVVEVTSTDDDCQSER